MAKEKNTSKLSRLAVMGIALLVLIVPFCLYYFVYVSSQQAYFIDRSHRSLAGISKQIVSRVDGLRSVVENAVRQRCEDNKAEEANKAEIETDPDKPGSLERYLEGLHPFGTDFELESASVDARGSPKPVITVKFRQDGSTILDYECGGSEEFKKGHFSVTNSDRQRLLKPAVARFVIDDRNPLDEGIFDRVFVADSDDGAVVFQYGLDSMTIVNLNDLLAAQTSSSSADTNAKPRQSDSRHRMELGSAELIKINIAGTNYKLFGQPIQLTAPKAGSNPEQGYELTVWGLVSVDHMTGKTFSFSYTLLLLFILGVLITALTGPLVKLRLIGPKDRLRKADVALAGCAVFFGTALLTLTLLDGYTYVSIENQLDGQLESLAGNVDRHLRTELARASDQLDELNRNLSVTLEGASAEFVCGRDEKQPRPRYYVDNMLGANGVLKPLSAPYPYFNNATWARVPHLADGLQDHEAGEQQIRFTTKRQHTAFVNVGDRQFFQDAIEEKLWNLTVSREADEATGNILLPLDELNSFLSDRACDFLIPRKLRFSMQPLNSRTSGENVAVISKLTPDKEYVSALDTRLLSLYQPVLPAGYRFCVIDGSGSVLFHTDDEKNLDENFFEECNQDRPLRAAVHTRQSEWVDLQYLGRAHRAFVTPIKELPWSLVVFRDKLILRTVNLEVMTLAAIAFGLYALLLTAMAAAFVFLPGSKARFETIWPNAKWVGCYRYMAVVNSVLFLICVAMVIVSSRGELVVLALLFPALALLHSLLVTRKTSRLMQLEQQLATRARALVHSRLVIRKTSRLRRLERRLAARTRAISRKSYSKVTGRPRKKKQRAPTLTNWQRSYALALVSMLAVTCVTPVMAFFKLTRDEQIRVFITHGQMSLAQGLERRENLVRSQYSSLNPAVDVGEFKEEFIRKRLDFGLDVYASFFFETNWTEGKKIEGQRLGGLVCWFLTTFSPFYNETCVESLRLVRGQSSDERWQSADRERVGLVLRPFTRQDDSPGFAAPADGLAESSVRQSGVDTQSEWTLTSVAPRFMELANPLLWLLALSLALMLVVAYFAARFAARRILLLDMKTPSCGSLSVLSAGPIDKDYLVLIPPAFDSPPVFDQRDGFVRIDLGSIRTEKEWTRETWRVTSMTDLPVVIDQFEVKRHEAGWNERKLRFVADLIRRERRVVIVSSVDPINFPLSADQKDSAKTANAAEQNSKKEDKSQGGKEESASSATPDDRSRDAERWSTALASFMRVIAFEPADPEACPALFSAVDAGDRPWRYLESLAPRVPTANALPEEVIADVGDQAENYYRAVWSTCSREERITLFRVAQDGLVSRLDPDLRRLIQKGFIRRDPSLRLMDESFRRFVISTAATEGVASYRADVDSNWERWKAPLSLILLGVIAFLFITQKELADSTLSLVSALTGGALALLKLFGMFQKGKGSSADQS